MDKALAGDPVLTHKGTDYGFSTKESDEGIREVLIPRQNGYKAGRCKRALSGILANKF